MDLFVWFPASENLPMTSTVITFRKKNTKKRDSDIDKGLKLNPTINFCLYDLDPCDDYNPPPSTPENDVRKAI